MELVSTLLHHTDAELVDPLVNLHNEPAFTCVIKIREAMLHHTVGAQSQTYIMKVRPLEQDNEEQLNEQLDMLPALCRFQLQPASSYIMTLFEPSANRYAQVLLTKLLFKLTRSYSSKLTRVR